MARRLVTSEGFAKEVAGGGSLEGLCVLKDATAEVEETPEGLAFVLSTATPDRSRDVVSQDGWRLDNFVKNPVMLWAHDYGQLPVGRPKSVGVETGRLVARGVEFPSREVYAFGWTVGEMYRKGFLHAVSVGFAPVKHARNEERGPWAMDFLEQELLEFSAVPVPANPEALQLAKAAGLEVAPFLEWAERVLAASPTHKAALAARSALAPVAVQVPPELEKLGKSLRKATRELEATRLALEEIRKEQTLPAVAPPAVKSPTSEQLAKAIAAEARKQLDALLGR